MTGVPYKGITWQTELKWILTGPILDVIWLEWKLFQLRRFEKQLTKRLVELKEIEDDIGVEDDEPH